MTIAAADKFIDILKTDQPVVDDLGRKEVALQKMQDAEAAYVTDAEDDLESKRQRVLLQAICSAGLRHGCDFGPHDWNRACMARIKVNQSEGRIGRSGFAAGRFFVDQNFDLNNLLGYL